MSKEPELHGPIDYLGVDEETVRAWEEEGLITSIPLPAGVRTLSREEVSPENVVYGPWPEGLLQRLTENVDSDKGWLWV